METFTQIFSFFQETNWLQAMIVVMLTYAIAKLISYLVPKALHKLSNWLKFPLVDQIIELFPNPIFYTVLLLGSIFAVSLLNLSEKFEFFVLASLRSVLIVVLSRFGLQLTKMLLEIAAGNPKILPVVQEQTLPLFKNLAIVVFMLGMFYSIFSTWNVDMSALLASAGIVGLAVGMAAKDTLSDVISGVLILADAPYRAGDTIILPDGTRGRVINIGIRSTRIQTLENFDLTIPNSIIGNSQIINETSNPTTSRMIAVDMQLAYGTDLDLVAAELTALANQHPSVLETPKCSMKVIELERERVHCRLLVWINPQDNRYLVEFALNEAIYKRFAEMGIAIFKPRENTLYVQDFPKQAQEIYIKEMPSVFGKPNVSSLVTGGSNLPKMTPVSSRDKIDELLKNRKNQPAAATPRTARPAALKPKPTPPSDARPLHQEGGGDNDDTTQNMHGDGSE